MTEQNPRAITREVLHRLTQDSEPWLSCDDCFALLDVNVERRLADSDDVHVAMATHLEACPACAEEAESLRALLAEDG
jgi:hypothetical protein